MVRRNMNSHLKYASQIAFSTKETLQFTYECALKMKDTEGDYVECGVAAGAQIIAMASAAPGKIIHAFDSFEGIPLPSNRDDQMPGIKYLSKKEQKALPNAGEQELVSSGATSFSLVSFLNHLHSSGVEHKGIVWHVGWFEKTMPMNSIEKIISFF
jgi:hypothetical protein